MDVPRNWRMGPERIHGFRLSAHLNGKGPDQPELWMGRRRLDMRQLEPGLRGRVREQMVRDQIERYTAEIAATWQRLEKRKQLGDGRRRTGSG